MANYPDDTPELLKDLDRINKMTPDQAYRYSVDSIGRDPAITKQMDAAATIPEDEMQRRRQAAAGAPVDVAAPKNPAPAAPPPREVAGGTIVEGRTPGNKVYTDANGVKTAFNPGGQGVTQFGNKVRVVDQKTDAVSWAGLDGKPIETPRSMKMASVWQDAIDKQSDESIARANGYAQSAIAANMDARKQRKMRRFKQNVMVGDQIGAARADLMANLKLAQERGKANKEMGEGVDTVLTNNDDEGKIFKAKDGNYYVRGIVDTSAINGFNEQAAKFGARDKMEKVVASQRVDEFGNPIGEPTYSVLYRKNGIANTGGDGVYVKSMTEGEAMRSIVRGQMGLGMAEKDAKKYTVGQFGVDPYGWKDELASHDTKMMTEKLRQEGMNHRADMRQGQFDRKMELQRQQLDEQVQKRLSAAKSAEERNNIIKEAKAAELKLRQDEIESKYAQMGVQYGTGETRQAAQEKISGKLTSTPDDKATPKPGDNKKWKDGAEYVVGMEVPVGGSVTRNGKTYYMWSDGNLHAKKEEVK